MFNSKKYVDMLFLQESTYKYKREIFDELYNKLLQTNISLIGLRQIGKTTLMLQLAKKYFDEHIKQKVNLNDNLKSSVISDKDKIFYLNVKTILNINEKEVRNDLFNAITDPKYKLIILDEIQEIEGWTNFLQSAIDLNKKCKFIVSGSNAIELNKEYMVGRMRIFYIQPLLYNEFIEIWKLKDNEKSIRDYLQFGSLPKSNDYFDAEIQYREIIESSIIDKIIIDDLKSKPDINKFKSLLKDFNNYIGNEINSLSIEKSINVSRQTVSEYLIMMEQARLIHTINKYNDKNHNRKKKVYYEDKSLIYLFSRTKELNNNLIGSLIENVVFNYLCYKFLNYPTLSEINYFRNHENKEIDFVLEEQKILLEVKYVENLDIYNLTKELNETIKAQSEFNNFRKVVVSKKNNEQNVNGWEFISIDNFLKGKLWE